MVRLLFALGLTILLLFGCTSSNTKLGLTTKQDCNSGHTPPLRDSERIACYHQAAITSAYMEDDNGALNMCTDIVGEIGNAHPDDDIGAKAETERNLCYFDIAKIIARQSNMQSFALNVCSNIRDTTGHSLTGGQVTKDTCNSEVKNLAGITTGQYYASQNNICTLALVLPLILGFALFEWRKN
jgi:hypothetical protein